MLYKIRFVFFRHIRHWGCKLLFINAVQYIFILLVPIRFVLGVVHTYYQSHSLAILYW